MHFKQQHWCGWRINFLFFIDLLYIVSVALLITGIIQFLLIFVSHQNFLSMLYSPFIADSTIIHTLPILFIRLLFVQPVDSLHYNFHQTLSLRQLKGIDNR